MNFKLLILEIFFSTIVSYLFTKALIQYSITHSLLDATNERSSHLNPTPRVGGISFVALITFTLICSYTFKLYDINNNIYFVLLAPPLFIAFVSAFDDVKGGISRRARLASHFLAVSLAFYLLKIFTGSMVPMAFSFILFIGTLWIINLYNFMDGIDGIAASEAIFVILASSGFALFNNHIDWAFIQITLVGPILGFLFLNWRPAKIFMGDIGSTYLGMLLPCILIVSVLMHTLTFWSCVILLGTFLTDASWTLLYRFSTSQKWYHPHRSHLYQILSRKVNSHAKVSLYNLAVNICWLLPLSYLANTMPDYGHNFTIIALIPLLVTCIMAKAGHKSSN
jgi:Fuc2NAc and GlcNAc transferase